MYAKHRVLFVQGGGKGAHRTWDSKLVESLRTELGQGYEVHYPQMPNESEPKYTSWKKALEQEIDQLPAGAILVAHSVGGTILLKVLTEYRPAQKLGGLFVIAAPFVGDGGWSADDLQFPADLGEHLPSDIPIHFYQGSEDDVAPSHIDLYVRAVPRAHAHRLAGRDHQLNNDLKEVAHAMLALKKAAD